MTTDTEKPVPNEQDGDPDLEQYKGDAGIVARYLAEIDLQRTSSIYLRYHQQGELATSYYLCQSDNAQVGTPPGITGWKSPFNILWSTIETLMPTYFARVPKPMCERRIKTSNPIPLLASEIAERCTTFQLAMREQKFKATVQDAIKDMLLPGMGTIWKGWECEFDDNGEIIPGTETLKEDFVYWQDFGWNSSRNWREVKRIWRRLLLTREECIDLFGEEIGKKISMEKEVDGVEKSTVSDEQKHFFKRAEVWQVCDKDKKMVFWVSKGYKSKPCLVMRDPWGFRDFFPCPNPLRATTSTQDFTPVSLFSITQWILDEITSAVRRVGILKSCIRYVGVHDPQFDQDIRRVQSQEDGVTVPAKSWPDIAQKGGLSGTQSWQDISNLVPAIAELSAYVVQLMQWYWEITGIPDIVRGQSNPQETAKAQQYKGNWTMIRTSQKQQEVQDFCAESVSMDGELIFEHFTDECIMQMAGYDEMTPEQQANFPAALAILRNDMLRDYKLFIETDSTLRMDQEATQASRTAFLQAIGGFLAETSQVLQMFPDLAVPMFESVMFTIRGWKDGEPLEGVWDKFITEHLAKLEEMKNQPPPPPPPDPNMLRAEAAMVDAQTKQRAQQLDEFIKPQELQLKGQTAQMQADIEMQKLGLEGLKAETAAIKSQTEAEIAATKAQTASIAEMFRQFIEEQRLDLEKFSVVSGEKEKLMEEQRLARADDIEVAKIQTQRMKIDADLKKNLPENDNY